MNRLLQLHKLNEQQRQQLEKQEKLAAQSPAKTIIIEGDFSELIADEKRRQHAKATVVKKNQ